MNIPPVFANSFAVNVTPGGTVEMTFAHCKPGQMIDPSTTVAAPVLEIERARQIGKLILQVTDPAVIAAQAAAVKASQDAAASMEEKVHGNQAGDPDKTVN